MSSYRRLVVEAARAQELAERAAGYEPSSPDLARPPTADEALRFAALAAAAAEQAGDVLAGLGVRDAFAPADFQDLLAHVPLMGPFLAPPVPATRVPTEVAPRSIVSAAISMSNTSMPANFLEQDRLAFHHRLRRQRTDIAETEHRGAVGDHRHQIGAGRERCGLAPDSAAISMQAAATPGE